MEADLPALLTAFKDSPPGVAKLPEFLSAPPSPLRPAESRTAGACPPLLLGSPNWPEEVVVMDSPVGDGDASPPAAHMANILLFPPPPTASGCSQEGCEVTLEAREDAAAAQANHDFSKEQAHAEPCTNAAKRTAVEAIPKLGLGNVRSEQHAEAEERTARKAVPPLGLGRLPADRCEQPLASPRDEPRRQRRPGEQALPPVGLDQLHTHRCDQLITGRQEEPQQQRILGDKAVPPLELGNPETARRAEAEQRISGKVSSSPVGGHAGDEAVGEPPDEDVYEKAAAAEQAAARKERVREQWQSQDRVRSFLSKHGYSGVCAPRRRLMGSSYPLHCAVKLRDAEMVELLLQFKADPQQENSGGLTPQQYALDLNRRGSHAEVMMALSRRASLSRRGSQCSSQCSSLP